MSKKNLLFLPVTGILLTLAFLVFAYFLSVQTFKNFARESMLSNYTFIVSEGVGKLEGLFKAPTQNMDRVRKILTDMQSDMHEGMAKNILIIQNKRILLSLNPDRDTLYGARLPEYVERRIDFHENEVRGVEYQEEYHYIIPLMAGGNFRAASLDIVFKKQRLEFNLLNENCLKDYQRGLLKDMGIILLAALTLLFFIMGFIPLYKKSGRIARFRVTAVLVILTLLSQGIFLLLNQSRFSQSYLELIRINTDLSAQRVVKKLQGLMDHGYTYQHIKTKVESIAMLDLLNKSLKAVDGAYILDPADGRMLSQSQSIRLEANTLTLKCKKDESSKEYEIPEGDKNYFLPKDSKGIEPMLYLVISKDLTEEKAAHLLYYLFLLMLVSLLVVLEASRFVIGKCEAGRQQKEEVSYIKSKSEFAARSVEFMFWAGAFMVLTAIPLMVNELWIPKQVKIHLSFLDQSMYLGKGYPSALTYSIPVALEMIFCAVSMFISGFVLKKLHWKPLFAAGLVVLCTGLLCSANSSSLSAFYISRSVCGLGLGMGLLALKITDITWKNSLGNRGDSWERVKYWGVPCGVASGALISDSFTPQHVFYAAFFLVLISGLLMVLLKNHLDFKLPPENKSPVYRGNMERDSIKRVILILVLLIPFSASGMFLDFFYPVFSYSGGITWNAASSIGLIFVLSGAVAIGIGPLFKRVLFYMIDEKLCAVLCSIMAFTSLLYVSAFEKYIVLAVMVMALWSVAGEASRFYYYSQLFPGSMDIWAVGRWYAWTWVGRAAGAVLFGYIASLETKFGVGIIGMIGCNISILFMIFTWNRYKHVVITHVKA
ncbi:MAG: MFS transporter [Clostridia bacterium]|nr:MFS transporter [Clostridia bacterium]